MDGTDSFFQAHISEGIGDEGSAFTEGAYVEIEGLIDRGNIAPLHHGGGKIHTTEMSGLRVLCHQLFIGADINATDGQLLQDRLDIGASVGLIPGKDFPKGEGVRVEAQSNNMEFDLLVGADRVEAAPSRILQMGDATYLPTNSLARARSLTNWSISTP